GLWLTMLSACANTGNAKTPDVSSPPPIAYLHANTGGDSMLAQRKQGYVLELHIIDGDHKIIPVATCDRISGGNALGGGTSRELEVMLCEGNKEDSGEYWLI